MHPSQHILHPNIPLIVPDTPLHTCGLLAEVRLHELSYWPRRHVAAVALLDGTQVAACGHAAVYALLCLN